VSIPKETNRKNAHFVGCNNDEAFIMTQTLYIISLLSCLYLMSYRFVVYMNCRYFRLFLFYFVTYCAVFSAEYSDKISVKNYMTIVTCLEAFLPVSEI
jgi:hypothetical protein